MSDIARVDFTIHRGESLKLEIDASIAGPERMDLRGLAEDDIVFYLKRYTWMDDKTESIEKFTIGNGGVVVVKDLEDDDGPARLELSFKSESTGAFPPGKHVWVGWFDTEDYKAPFVRGMVEVPSV